MLTLSGQTLQKGPPGTNSIIQAKHILKCFRIEDK